MKSYSDSFTYYSIHRDSLKYKTLQDWVRNANGKNQEIGERET